METMNNISTQINTNNTNLYPIRIDASTNDKGVRIVDTLLYDPTCPPYINNSNNNNSIEDMAKHLADTFLADMEVYNMIRSTSKHFSGRINLLGRTELYKEVQQQIRNQLYSITRLYKERQAYTKEKQGMTRKVVEEGSGAQHYKKIVIRIKNGDAQIDEDFYWDTSSTDTCPIAMAKVIAQDVSPTQPELAVDIATSIVEQLHGAPVVAQEASIVTTNHGLLKYEA